jgi:hypothetical protein
VSITTTAHTQLYWLLLIVSLATIVSGIVQLVKPEFVLGIVSAGETVESEHFFAIVGMFMALFGGLLTQVLLSNQRQPAVVFIWAGLQKLGASAAVGLGVARHIFGPLALGISAFDLTSGILIFIYLGGLNRQDSR